MMSLRLPSNRKANPRRPKRSLLRRSNQSRWLNKEVTMENSSQLLNAFNLLAELVVAVEVAEAAVVETVVSQNAVAAEVVEDVDVVMMTPHTDTRARLVRKLTHSTANLELVVARETSKREATAKVTGDLKELQSMILNQSRKKRPRSSQRSAQSQNKLRAKRRKVSPLMTISLKSKNLQFWPRKKLEVMRR